MVDIVKEQPKTNKPAVVPTRDFRQPVSSSQPVRDDPSKRKIASQLIEAIGDKLIELNFIPPTMTMKLIILDVLEFNYKYPESTAEEIIEAFRSSIYHHLRGVKGAFIKSVVDLAKEEYRGQQNQDGNANINQL